MTFRLIFLILAAVGLAAGTVAAGTIDENKALVLNFIAAENSQDFKKLPTYISEDFKRHSEASPNVPVANRDQFIAHMRDGVDMFLDTKFHVEHMIAEGDLVAVWASYKGGVAGKGADPKIDINVSMIYRVEGDKIAELWVIWDNNALRSQLDSHGSPEKNRLVR